MAHEHAFARTLDPIILTVPGIDNSGPDHWQTLWEQTLPDCHRVDLGLWSDPHRNTWVNKLALAIQRAHESAGRPVVLVAHSLGCLAVAWWAEYERLANGLHAPDLPVIGALLVAPPDVEDGVKDRRLTRFARCPRQTCRSRRSSSAAAMIPMPRWRQRGAWPSAGARACRCRLGWSHQRAIGPGRMGIRPPAAQPPAAAPALARRWPGQLCPCAAPVHRSRTAPAGGVRLRFRRASTSSARTVW
jgi:predicted alpha/beta hydrolase family esterase